MIWLAFSFAFVSVCLGYGLAVFIARRSKSGQGDDGEPSGERRNDSDVSVDTEEVREFLHQLQELAVSVDSDVDRHANRVTEITGRLTSQSGADSASVLAAAAQLIDANKQLQTDLAFAKAEIHVQRQQLDSYMAEARTDVLTGLANRRAFNEEVNRRFAQFHRHGTPVSLVLMDVDHFKQFNDSYGHQAGDGMLHAVAEVLQQTVREMDSVTRYGGEEFAVILPGTNLNAGESAAERLRTAVAGHRFVFSGTPLHVTVSLGVAEAMPFEGAEGLIKRADQALYTAKDAGRNCGYVHTGETCERIEELPTEALSRPETRRVRIAPYVDGRFVEWDMFHEVDCQDVSSTGFSYLTPEEPDYEQVVVTMGDDGDRSYMSAHVESCLNIGTDDEPVYVVRCQFIAPADAEETGGAVFCASPAIEHADIPTS